LTLKANPCFLQPLLNLLRKPEKFKVVSENIKDEPAKIAVEGHTDAVPFRGGKITNWELSTERASSARRELEKNGVDPS
jgi:Flagellar motor protein